METNNTGALARKLAGIVALVGKVPKSGYNAFHHYDYVTENDLVYAVRQHLADAFIFVFTSVEAQHVEITGEGDEKTALTTVVTKHTFVDGETGESFSVLSQGQGVDKGDKGGYKAITGAMKYFVYKNFLIPTGDDPEADTRTDERASAEAQTRAAAPAATRAAAPAAKPVEVRREVGLGEIGAARAQFEGGAWQSVKIHFGKQKGNELRALDAKSLAWWIGTWQPMLYNGVMDPKNILLRAALDVANVEWK